MKSSRFRPNQPTLSDELMSAVHATDQSPEDRLGIVMQRAGRIVNILGNPSDTWATDPHRTTAMVHNIMAASALPSIVASVKGEPQTLEIAQKVGINLRRNILKVGRAGLLNPGVFRVRPHDARDLGGSLNELAVFSLIWDGIGSDVYTPNSFAWPATSRDDRGTIIQNRNTGYDIGLYELGGERFQRVQVKGGLEIVADGENGGYHDSIALISPELIIQGTANEGVFEPTNYGAATILRAVALGERLRVLSAGQAAKRIIRAEQARYEEQQATEEAMANEKAAQLRAA